MPTILSARSEAADAVRRLSLVKTIRFVILTLRVRRLNRQMAAAYLRCERESLDAAGPDLVWAVDRWAACHQAIASLLGIPEPPHVAQVRARLRGSQRADQGSVG